MESLSENIRYRRSEGFVARTICGETILVPLRQRLGDLESIYTLNTVATFIWERLAASSTSAEIAVALEGEFGGEPAEMRQDLAALLEELLELKAVESTDLSSDILDPTSQP